MTTTTTMGMRQTQLRTPPVLQSLIDVGEDSEAPLVTKEEATPAEDRTDQASGLVASLMTMTMITQVVPAEARIREEQ